MPSENSLLQKKNRGYKSCCASEMKCVNDLSVSTPPSPPLPPLSFQAMSVKLMVLHKQQQLLGGAGVYADDITLKLKKSPTHMQPSPSHTHTYNSSPSVSNSLSSDESIAHLSRSRSSIADFSLSCDEVCCCGCEKKGKKTMKTCCCDEQKQKQKQKQKQFEITSKNFPVRSTLVLKSAPKTFLKRRTQNENEQNVVYTFIRWLFIILLSALVGDVSILLGGFFLEYYLFDVRRSRNKIYSCGLDETSRCEDIRVLCENIKDLKRTHTHANLIVVIDKIQKEVWDKLLVSHSFKYALKYMHNSRIVISPAKWQNAECVRDETEHLWWDIFECFCTRFTPFDKSLCEHQMDDCEEADGDGDDDDDDAAGGIMDSESSLPSDTLSRSISLTTADVDPSFKSNDETDDDDDDVRSAGGSAHSFNEGSSELPRLLPSSDISLKRSCISESPNFIDISDDGDDGGCSAEEE
jgi:hypothetical protein